MVRAKAGSIKTDGASLVSVSKDLLLSSSVSRSISEDDPFSRGLEHKTILVAGASGYLGSALLGALQTIPCKVVALSWNSRSLADPASKDQEFIELKSDLSKAGSWTEPLRSERPDVVFNLAAYEHRRGSQHSPEQDLALNAATMLDLLETCRRLELKPQIVFASSANLAGCPDSLPVDESFPDQPLTLYAIHKLAAERYLKYYATTFGIPGAVLRFANVYGPLPNGPREIAARVVLNRIMLQALAGGPLQLYANRDCRRDFVYIDDAVRALCAAGGGSTLKDGGYYLIGGEESFTLAQIVSLIAERSEAIAGRRPEIRFVDDAVLEPLEWREFVADCTLMRTRTGWHPQIRMREGIDRTLRKFQEH
jgi:UDP-glucose 4-epimerase